MKSPRVLVSCQHPAKAEPYLEALRAAGIEPIACAPGPSGDLATIDGLLLTGGADIAPKYYGQPPDPDLGETNPERDTFEFGLLALADASKLPVLAICRGLQLLNVHRGGTLIQHLPQTDRHRRRDTLPCDAVHSVAIEPGSRLEGIFETRAVQVNSRHHQAIDRLGAGLTITARDPNDGVVEAVEDPSRRFLVAVQGIPRARRHSTAYSKSSSLRLLANWPNDDR